MAGSDTTAKGDSEGGTGECVARHELQLAAVVVLNDLAGNAQSESHTVLGRGEVRIEDPVTDVIPDAGTGVRKVDLEPVGIAGDLHRDAACVARDLREPVD